MKKDWLHLCLYPEIKFQIIKHFIQNPELRQNQSQIARNLRSSQVSISRHISDLVSLRVLHEEKFGKASVYWLNTHSALVNRLLTRIISLNQDFLSVWIEDRMKLFPKSHLKHLKKLILFGSAARRELKVSSDIDLLAVASKVSSDLEAELQLLLVAGGSEEGFKISLFIASSSIYEKASGGTYLEIAKKEGVIIWPRQ